MMAVTHLFLLVAFATPSAAAAADGSCPSGSDATCAVKDDVNMLQTYAKLNKMAQQSAEEDDLVHAVTKERVKVKQLEVHPDDIHDWQMTYIQTADEAAEKKKEDHEFDEHIKHILKKACEISDNADICDAWHRIKKMDDEEEDEDIIGPAPDHDIIKEAIEIYEKFEGEQEVDDEDVDDNIEVTSAVNEKLNDLPNTPERTSSGNCHQGDECGRNTTEKMMLLQASALGLREWAGTLWAENMGIRYCFQDSIAPSSKKAFQEAVQHFVDHIPCLGFKEVASAGNKCAEEPAIFVQSSDSGCYANVGEPWKDWNGNYGSSVCNLQPNGCDTLGVAAHELGHNLGMLHEQSRTDHEKFVRILWDNIQPSMRSQYREADSADKSVPYDISSLMHYSDTAFGLPGKKTMVPVGSTKRTMGNRQGLSHADAIQVARMYKCEDALKEFKLCTEKMDEATEGDCMCHAGSGLIKTRVAASNGKPGGYQCVQTCPDAPYGQRNCGCREGCQKDCFMSGGKEYCSCKDCPSPEATTKAPKKKKTTPEPTSEPTTTHAPTTTKAPSKKKKSKKDCDDGAPFCGQFADYCAPCVTLNDKPIFDLCPRTCFQCPGQDPPCKDDYKNTCTLYGDQYCPYEYVTINNKPYATVCKKTCGKCGSSLLDGDKEADDEDADKKDSDKEDAEDYLDADQKDDK